MSDTIAPRRRIDKMKDLISQYETLAAERPLTDEEATQAIDRYIELLHSDDEQMTDERRKELIEQYDAKHTAYVASKVAMLVTDEQREALLANGRRSLAGEDVNVVPVVRLFAPDGKQQWLLTELAEDGDTAHGLCDLGIGLPECGEVSLAWLAAQSGAGEKRAQRPSAQEPRTVYTRMGIERDPHFPSADTPRLSYLDRMASVAGRIVI